MDFIIEHKEVFQQKDFYTQAENDFYNRKLPRDLLKFENFIIQNKSLNNEDKRKGLNLFNQLIT